METMQESNDYFSFMINDFDESILFSLSLIQSAIERVTIVLGCLHVCRSFFLQILCQLVVDVDIYDDFNIYVPLKNYIKPR